MHGSVDVSGTLALDSCEKPGGSEGGPSFRRGASLPPAGG
jgi:hypothetical protein